MATGIAGLLLLLPGVLSDVAALVLLLPAVQRKLSQKAKEYALKNQDKMMAMMAKQMGGQSPFGNMGGFGAMGGGNPFGGMGGNSPFTGGTTIDGEAKVKPNKVKAIKPANDS